MKLRTWRVPAAVFVITITLPSLLFLCGLSHLGIYQLTLEASPTEGPAPLSGTFTARITGGPDFSPELHCKPESWDFGEGFIQTRMGLCRRYTPGERFQRYFSQVYLYENPGTYEARFSYGPLESDPVTIRVTK